MQSTAGRFRRAYPSKASLLNDMDRKSLLIVFAFSKHFSKKYENKKVVYNAFVLLKNVLNLLKQKENILKTG